METRWSSYLGKMFTLTELEAIGYCSKLASESPLRTTHSWIPKQKSNGDWMVLRVNLPSPNIQRDKMSESEGAAVAKSDPRTLLAKNIGPNH